MMKPGSETMPQEIAMGIAEQFDKMLGDIKSIEISTGEIEGRSEKLEECRLEIDRINDELEKTYLQLKNVLVKWAQEMQ